VTVTAQPPSVPAAPPAARPLRVALLNPCYWPEVRRGSERFARELADGLIARGHRPRLLTSHPGRPSRTVEDGMEVVRAWRPPEGRLRRRQFESHLTHVPFSYRELRRGDDDLAHALYQTDALAAVEWARRTGRPAIFSVMGVPTRKSLMVKRRRLELFVRLTREADAVVALSRAVADAMERALGVRPRVIPAGVNTAAFTPDPAARAPRPTIFCAAAADQPQKRVGLLLDAFARVRRERPDAALVLSRPRDPRLATELGRPGVELRDVDDRAALTAAYREAWVSALPSTGEAFGLVLAEAMACGTPAVATRDGGMPEIIDSAGVGRLFDGDDPDALARALLEAFDLAADPATPVACRARAERVSTGRCTEAYLGLYRELRAR
jgi:glycosyltransferase involved in cell wall biosynthesis